MCRFAQLTCLFAISAVLSATGTTAEAQDVVTTYYPPQATVTYLPVQRGLLGLRTSYEPFVGLAPATTVTRYAPAPSVVTGYPVAFAASTSTAYYAPVEPVITTYYAPAPVVTYYAPARTYYAPAPVTTYYVSPAYYVAPAPVVVGRVTYYVSP